MTWWTQALTFVGLALLLGGGVFGRLIGVGLPPPRALPAVGALLLLGAGMWGVLGTLRDIFGTFDLGDLGEFLAYATLGQALLARILGVMLWCLALRLRPVWPLVAAGLLLLASVSWAGHAHTAGAALFALDMVHLGAMCVWIGAVLYLALLPSRAWRAETGGAWAALRRTSAAGLWSVVALSVSGTVAAVARVPAVSALPATAYGQTLLIKLGLFAAILLLAALNRFQLMRAPEPGPLRAAVRLESGALAGVLLISGVLSTSAPPQFPRAVATSVPVRVSFAGQSVGGRVSLSGRGRLEVRLSPPQQSAPLQVVLLPPAEHGDHADHASHDHASHLPPGQALRLSRNGSALQAVRQLWTPGRWAVAVELGQAAQLVPLELR